MMHRKTILLILLFGGIVLLSAACSGDGGMVNSDQGQVRIVMASSVEPLGVENAVPGSIGSDPDTTRSPMDGDRGDDSARDKLKAANVTFSAVVARNLDGELIDVSMDLPRTINMLGFAGGGTVDLPVGFLPPGMYDQLIVVMTEVQFVLLNDLTITITPPLGGWTAIVGVRPQPFEVIEGETTTVRLRFFPYRLFRENGDGFHFHPEFELDD